MADSVVAEILEDFGTFDSCVLSVDPVTDDDGDVQGLEILRSFGGPTVWVNTYECTVHAHEQGAEAIAELSPVVSAYLDTYYGGRVIG
jgi:hypothetical protein